MDLCWILLFIIYVFYKIKIRKNIIIKRIYRFLNYFYYLLFLGKKKFKLKMCDEIFN